MKQVNIGVRNGLAVLVNDGARQVTVCLMGTLHIDFAVILFRRHADGIEADHLPDGIRYRLAPDGCGDAEVFQFVVEEHDVVLGLVLG